MPFDLKHLYLILALVCGIIGTVPYLRDILRRETKPHVFTWLVWGLSSAICFAAQVWDHGGLGAWATLYGVVKCLGFAALALPFGEKRITRSDWASFLCSLAAIPLWLVTHNPLWSVVWLLIIETIAFFPTFRKAWAKPWEETLSAWLWSIGQFFFGLLALQHYTPVTALFPGGIVILNIVFIFYLLIRRRAVRR